MQDSQDEGTEGEEEADEVLTISAAGGGAATSANPSAQTSVKTLTMLQNFVKEDQGEQGPPVDAGG